MIACGEKLPSLSPTASVLRHTRSRSAILAHTRMRMRRGRREVESEENGREAMALLALAEMLVRLFGQVVEWSCGYFDDRSGSEKLTQ